MYVYGKYTLTMRDKNKHRYRVLLPSSSTNLGRDKAYEPALPFRLVSLKHACTKYLRGVHEYIRETQYV